MSLERNDRIWGQGTLLGDHGDSFFDKSTIEKARDLGWSNGCPVVERLVKPQDEGGRGSEYMAKRYGEINFWFGYIKDVLSKSGNTNILSRLQDPQKRNNNESLGKHDQGWPPQEIDDYMYGLQTPEGYALPRVVGEFIKNNPENVYVAMDVIDDCVKSSKDATELLVNMSQKFVDLGADEKAILKHVLSTGKLAEDNCLLDYKKIASVIKSQNSSLSKVYFNLSNEDLKELHIAEVII